MKKFQNKARFVVTVIIAAMLAFTVSGCSYVSKGDKEEIVDFYISFADEATSLDPEKIKEAYTELAKEDFEGQSSNAVRDKMFSKFDAVDPDVFSKIHFTDSSYKEIGKTYSIILLMSLATGGEGVDVTMPLDAVSSYKDKELDRKVYEIDRSKITATVSESLALKVDRPKKMGLSPVKLVKEGEDWKILADSQLLTEIGIPLSEKIAAPTPTPTKK